MRIENALAQYRITENRSVGPVSPSEAPRAPEPAYVRGNVSGGNGFGGLYGADARLRGADAAAEDLADERTVNSLEQRDRQVRQEEEAKGEAVGGRNYIYQTGPDGKRYAIGTAAHAVRQNAEEGDITDPAAPRSADGKELTDGDKALLQKLEARDAKVRSHEAAHVLASAGQAQGLPTYTYQTGPDGKRYAVGGSVRIATLKTGDAEGDTRRAMNAYRAAMATGEPSARDMQTAAASLAAASRAKSEE